MKPRPSLVLIGNGMAGVRALEELLKLAPDLYDITVYGAEPHGNYNRILLSPVLAGEKCVADIITHPREWYAANGITLYAGDPAAKIDRVRRTVHSMSGRITRYDRLLVATGSRPFILPVPGNRLPGVIAFRDIADVDTMLAAARQHKRAVVIGGGLLGLEAANGLSRQGIDVTVVHLMDHLMERQLDAPAAELLRRNLESRGLRFLLKTQTAEIAGRERVEAVRFKDGSEIPADLVVMAAGIQPNIELAKVAGLSCERGLLVNDTLQTFDPRIYAVGECVQHRKLTYGLVAPVWEQARVCATHLARQGHRSYRGSVLSTQLKVTGIDLYSAGDFLGGSGTEDLVYKDLRRGVYKRLVLRGNRIEGAVLYGDTQDGPWYFELMQRKADVGGYRNRLVFGRRFVEAAAA